MISPVLRPALHFYSFHFILVIPLNILGHTVVDGSQISLPGGDPSDGTFVKSFNLLEMKITRPFCFNVIKLHEDLEVQELTILSSSFLMCPTDLIKLEITEKAQNFGLKMHSEKR